MNTSINIKHSRWRRRHRQWPVWRILLAGILLVCLVGAAIVPMSVQAAESCIAQETRDSVSDASSITQEEPAAEESGEKETVITEEPDGNEATVTAEEPPAEERPDAEKEMTETATSEETTAAGETTATVEAASEEAQTASKETETLSEETGTASKESDMPIGGLPIRSMSFGEDTGTADRVIESEDDATMTLQDVSETNEVQDTGALPLWTYEVDPFDADYSAGYFCITNSTGHGIPYKKAQDLRYGWSGWGNGWTGWCGSNSARSDDIYVDHTDGVCMNGTYYDVREYTWLGGNASYCISEEGSVGATRWGDDADSKSSFVRREFHFYESGTLDRYRNGEIDSVDPYETSFRGVMRLSDLDKHEGYTLDQGVLGVWINDPTCVTQSAARTWRGTKDTGNTGSSDKEYSMTVLQAIWVEVEGSAETPLILTYHQYGVHESETNYTGCKITYRFVTDGQHALPEGAEDIQAGCATYSNYVLVDSVPTYRYYEFDGWYYDEALQQQVPETDQTEDGEVTHVELINEDKVFYGTYHRVSASIDTEVITVVDGQQVTDPEKAGGRITDPIEEILLGRDVTITYAPNEGYVLDTVTVDGKAVDPETYGDAYEFKNIQDNHKVTVVYVAGTAPVKAVSKGGVNVENEVLSSGEEVRYSITVQNPTSQPRDIVVYDEVDERLRICAAEDGGEVEGQAITWLLEDVAAGAEVTVHFRATLIGRSTEQEVPNVAYMHMSGSDVLPSNEVRVIIAPVPKTTTDTTHKTREETETIRTINYETVTRVVEVPQVAVPTVAPVEPVAEVAVPVIAEVPAVSGIAATGDDSLMWVYLAAAGAAALTLAAWFVRNARQMR